MTTQERLSVEKSRAVWMCGSAMFTIVMSRTTMSWQEAITNRASPLPPPWTLPSVPLLLGDGFGSTFSTLSPRLRGHHSNSLVMVTFHMSHYDHG